VSIATLPSVDAGATLSASAATPHLRNNSAQYPV
jgi:hypothetical protein